MSYEHLESLISSHRTALIALYTSLSPSPEALYSPHLSTLESLLTTTLSTQLESARNDLATAQLSLDEAWKRVHDWRVALGESPESGKQPRAKEGEPDWPVLRQREEVDEVLSAMRGRMEERGVLMVRLNERLKQWKEVLGAEWVQVEVEDVERGWEGLDLRLDRMGALEAEVRRCEQEIAHRRALLNANCLEIIALRAELGIHQGHPSSLPSPPSSFSAISYSQHPEGVNFPSADEFDEAILAHLGIGEDEGREKKELKPTQENVNEVEAKRSWLEEEKAHRNGVIQATYDKLYPLWTMLGTSEDEMEDFVNRWMGSTGDVVNAYQAELNRMLLLKRSNLATFIMRERESLTILYDALYLSPQQRLSLFPPFTISVAPTRIWNDAQGVEEEVVNDNVSEELLVAHERERERVECEVESMRGVLERLERYFGVVEEMRELEASASDPSRLLGKSTRGDPGRLLREEKARKRVAKEKPKLESELRQYIPMWEEENGRPFLVNGQRFLDELDRRMAEAAEKESSKKARKPTSSSASTTRPTSAASNSRPAPLRAQMTGGSSISVPIKRQMTGASSVSTTSSSRTQAPAAKRQVPMTTGGSTVSSRSVGGGGVLGDVGNAAGGQKVARGRGLSVSNGAGLGSGGGGGGGMKIPAGWGATSTTVSGGQNTFSSAPSILPQRTGGFKPRPSQQMGFTGSLLGPRS